MRMVLYPWALRKHYIIILDILGKFFLLELDLIFLMCVLLKYLVFGLYRTIYGNFFSLLFNSRVQVEAGVGIRDR